MKKTNWKSVLLYIIRIVELVITGAAGGRSIKRTSIETLTFSINIILYNK